MGTLAGVGFTWLIVTYDKSVLYLALINGAGGLYRTILTKVVNRPNAVRSVRTTEVKILSHRLTNYYNLSLYITGKRCLKTRR